MILTQWHSRKDKTMETVKRSMIARGWGSGGKQSRQSPADCEGSESTPSDTPPLSKPRAGMSPRGSPAV